MLQCALQIEHSLKKKAAEGPRGKSTVPLGFLFGRFEFVSFHKMLLCLIEINSTVEVIFQGVLACMR